MVIIVSDLSKKFNRVCNRVIYDLLITSGIDTRTRNIDRLQKQLEDSDYKILHWVQSHSTGQENIYVLKNKKNNTYRGYSVRLMLTKDNGQISKRYYKSEDEITLAFGFWLRD